MQGGRTKEQSSGVFTLPVPNVTLLAMTRRPVHERPIHVLRWKNFRGLMGGHHGAVTDAAYKLSKSQAQVSAFGGERPHRNIGDEIAQEIEKAYLKPSGWLDYPHPTEGEEGQMGSGMTEISVSESALPDPGIVEIAEKWVRFEEATAKAEYPSVRRAERLIELCRMIEADGGSLTPEHSEAIIEAARARQKQGVSRGRSKMDRGRDHKPA